MSWIQTTWTTLSSPVHSNNYSYCHQHFFSVTEISIPWLILETCCTSRSLACLIISSNCWAWNVWSSFSLFKSARNIFISPRNVDALTCIDRLSFTRPENIQCISKETDNTTMTYSHHKGEVMENGIKNTYNCFAFHSSSFCLGLKIEKQKFGCFLKGHHTWRQTNLHI